MANLRSGFKIQGERLTAAGLDELSGRDPTEVEGLEELAAAIARRADWIVRAGLELTLDVDDLSIVELEALAMAREKQQARLNNLLAVSIAQAIRTENLSSLIPDDLAPDVREKKYILDFELRAWRMMHGEMDV